MAGAPAVALAAPQEIAAELGLYLRGARVTMVCNAPPSARRTLAGNLGTPLQAGFRRRDRSALGYTTWLLTGGSTTAVVAALTAGSDGHLIFRGAAKKVQYGVNHA